MIKELKDFKKIETAIPLVKVGDRFFMHLTSDINGRRSKIVVAVPLEFVEINGGYFLNLPLKDAEIREKIGGHPSTLCKIVKKENSYIIPIPFPDIYSIIQNDEVPFYVDFYASFEYVYTDDYRAFVIISETNINKRVDVYTTLKTYKRRTYEKLPNKFLREYTSYHIENNIDVLKSDNEIYYKIAKTRVRKEVYSHLVR